MNEYSKENNVNLFRLEANFHDILKNVKKDLHYYKSIVEYFRITRYHDYPVNRAMIVYPMGAEHRMNVSNPHRYEPQYGGKIEETEYFTAYTASGDVPKRFGERYWGAGGNPNTGIYMKERFSRDVDKSIQTIIDRIRAEMKNDELDVIEMSLAVKGFGMRLYRHRDKISDWQRSPYRYHCIIESSPHNFLITGKNDKEDLRVVPKEGEIWALQVDEMHKAENLGDTDVWHFIIDFI